MKKGRLEELAAALKQAEKTCVAIGPLSAVEPDLAMEDAYRIQLVNIKQEVAQGKKITGKKIGLTSQAMQKMLGVNQPDFGYLLDSMEIDAHTVPRRQMLQPKAEGEIAFVLKEDLVGPGVTVDDVLQATAYVAAAIEVVDSRVADWKINIIDTIADNASSGMYVISSHRVAPTELDLKQIRMEFYKNGEKINEGVGTDVLGDPAFCVAWLANTLGEFGVSLKKGEVILSGALTAAITAEAGDQFRAVFSELGAVEVKFV